MNDFVVKKMMDAFPQGFINNAFEFIAEPKANIYCSLKNIETEKDLFKKVIHCFSRPAFKSEPFSSKKRNDLLHAQFLKAVNKILETNFSEEQISKIYTHLGNGVNESLTEKFINSGFDISVLENNDEA